MKEYNPNKLLSFKCAKDIEKEATLWRIYKRHGETKVSLFDVEYTDNPNIIITTSEIVENLKSDEPHGFKGTIKNGYYRLNGNKVMLSNPHCVYNGEAYIQFEVVNDSGEEQQDIKDLFNASENMLDKMERKGKIDEGMYEICKHFCDLGFNTVFCCSGHKKHKAYITFSTNINYEKLENLVENLEFIDIKREIHHKGHFKFLKIYFELTDYNKQEIMKLR